MGIAFISSVIFVIVKEKQTDDDDDDELGDDDDKTVRQVFAKDENCRAKIIDRNFTESLQRIGSVDGAVSATPAST